MDNLSSIEEYTALNGLGASPIAERSEEEDLSTPAPARSSTILPYSGSIPGWLQAGFQSRYSSPAPSIYSWQSFAPKPGQQDASSTDPSSAEFYVGMPAGSGGAVSGSSGPVAQAAASNIAANSQNVLTPQAGTVGVDPNRLSIAQVINTLLGVTATGVAEVQRQKLAATLLRAQKNKQPVYLPPQVVQKSQVPVGLLVGAGALVAVGVVLYFVLRKKS